MTGIADLNLREIELFVISSQTKSLRETARRAGLLPAHVSKIMKRFEEKIGSELFLRSSAGIALTARGIELLKTAEQLIEISRRLDSKSNSASPREKLWTIGSISFLSSYLIAPQIGVWRKQLPNTRFRLIEFTHNQLVPLGLQGAFELAIHIGRNEWTHTWETIAIRKLSWKLYGKFGHRLGEKCKQADLLEHRFVVPTDWHQHGYSSGNDFCPLGVSQRIAGDEASTAETALELVRGSDQLTFVPEILAKNWCENKYVQEISVTDWPVVEKEIFLSVKADKVPQKIVNMLVKSL